MKHTFSLMVLTILIGLLLVACTADQTRQGTPPTVSQPDEVSAADTTDADVTYTLKTGSGPAGLAFIGVGGDIDGIANPTLTAAPGATVSIRLINGDGMRHDLTIDEDELDVATDELKQQDASTTATFTVPESGTFSYFCSIPGHRQAGMEGTLQVEE